MTGCSGARTKYVAPKIVSGRVVNTSISLFASTLKLISAPDDLPIQFLCDVLIDSGQSKVSKSSRSLSA